MKISMKVSVITCFLLLLTALISGTNQSAQAQPGAAYELVGTVGTGGTAVSGSYQTDVMIGQAAVGQHMSGQYELNSGFWGGGIVIRGAALIQLYLPFILR